MVAGAEEEMFEVVMALGSSMSVWLDEEEEKERAMLDAAAVVVI